MPKDNDSITIKDAYKLKHELNKSITYKGMDSRQIQQTKKMTREDWTRVREVYKKWIREMQTIPDWGLMVFAVIGFVFAFAFEGWLRWLFIIVAVSGYASLSKRQGHAEGYIDGYGEGIEEGVNRGLGLNEEDAQDVFERAMEMEMDEGLVSKWNKEDGGDLNEKQDS